MKKEFENRYCLKCRKTTKHRKDQNGFVCLECEREEESKKKKLGEKDD